ncbi:MAG: TolC family protein [Planctomycetia bacterium]|nr:TolC family protein [Planctomycetia bacterium]
MARMFQRFSAPRHYWLSAAAAGCLTGCLPLCPPRPEYPPPPAVHCPAPCERPVEEAFDPDAALLPARPELIDLPTALQLADRQNPQIAVARERIREALAVQDRAEALWLPQLEFGPTWMRHDGQIQRATGEVLTISRSSLFVGGAVNFNWELGELLYAPLVTRQFTAARAAGAAATANDRLLDVAVVYFDLLQTYALIEVNRETLANARHLLELTENYEKAGKGAAADTARARVEVNLRETERFDLESRVLIVSARLAQLVQLPPETIFRPVEPALVPLAVVPESAPLTDLIAQAVNYRPELGENRALVLAALERWRAAKVTPLVPRLQLAVSGGGFGGGQNGFFGDFGPRSDVAVGAVWRLNQFGVGDAAVIRERAAQYAQAIFQRHTVEAAVAAQVVQQFGAAFALRRALGSSQTAVASARVSYELNEERIRRAPEQGRPIELLQAIQALARARQEYVQTIADYSRSQLRLYTALGNPPLCALETMRPLPLREPPVPQPVAEELPPPKPVANGNE